MADVGDSIYIGFLGIATAFLRSLDIYPVYIFDIV